MKIEEFFNEAKRIKRNIDEEEALINKSLHNIGNYITKAAKTNDDTELKSLHKTLVNFRRVLFQTKSLDSRRDREIEMMLEEISLFREPGRKKDKSEITKLIDAFEHVSKYNKIMGILVDNNYCQAVTYFWKDSNKGELVALLKYLGKQGYYGHNNLSQHEMRLIAKNTFNVDVSVSHIKQSGSALIELGKLIQAASTLS